VNANPSLRPGGVTGVSRFASPRTALVVGFVWLGLLVGSLPLAAFAHQLTFGGEGIFLPIAPFALVGLVLARKVPRNPIGWILLAIALAGTISTDVGFYAVRAVLPGDRALPLARIAVFFAPGWFWLILLMPLPIALFPDGRLPPRWRWTLTGYTAACAILLAVFTWQDVNGIVAPHIRIDSTGELTIFGNSPNRPLEIAERAFVPVYSAFFLGWVIRQVVGYSRAAGVQRQQLKWLFSGGAICVFGLLLAITASGTPVGAVAWLGIAALPAGIGVGVLRYRLYEIDRLISRTISYTLLTATLGGVFVGGVVLLTHVLPFSSPVAVAASTLAAAALFSPLRLRTQRLIDRRFNRARYEVEAILTAFSGRLRQTVDLMTIEEELLEAVNVSLAPRHTSLWIKPRA
jgi:hypothetical protein